MAGHTLQAFLKSGSFAAEPYCEAVSATITALARASVEVQELTSQGALNLAYAASRKTANTDGDVQVELDVLADGIFLRAVKDQPVAVYASEENKHAILFDPTRPLALAIDPLDGSSNVETNLAIGTIFSIMSSDGLRADNPDTACLQPGRNQIAAGFFIYGPQLALVLTVGTGTRIFIYSARNKDFVESYDFVSIPPNATEFAVNASNYRHWEEPVRLYVDDCLAGTEGPREKDFNMRWNASLVAECYRILIRGGVFLYPADGRKGYSSGRLRLIYEANPIAFIIEDAGGKATDSVNRILDIKPGKLHERVPLVFGSGAEVDRISRYHTDPSLISERSPLFGNRGLFRA